MTCNILTPYRPPYEFKKTGYEISDIHEKQNKHGLKENVYTVVSGCKTAEIDVLTVDRMVDRRIDPGKIPEWLAVLDQDLYLNGSHISSNVRKIKGEIIKKDHMFSVWFVPSVGGGVFILKGVDIIPSASLRGHDYVDFEKVVSLSIAKKWILEEIKPPKKEDMPWRNWYIVF